MSPIVDPPDGLRFECTQCGKCCTARGEYAYVYLSPEEARAIAHHLGLRVREFKRKYTFVDEYGWTQLRFETERCVFLDPETQGCTIYAARPTQCRTFPFWRDMIGPDGRWTDDARELCEGLGRGPTWPRREVEARIEAFEASEEED